METWHDVGLPIEHKHNELLLKSVNVLDLNISINLVRTSYVMMYSGMKRGRVIDMTGFF